MGRKQTLLGVFLKKACNGVVQERGSSRGPGETREWADFWLTQLWTLINSLVFLLGPVNTLARSWKLPGTIFGGWQPGPGPVCVCVLGLLGLETLLGKYTPGTKPLCVSSTFWKSPCLWICLELLGSKLPTHRVGGDGGSGEELAGVTVVCNFEFRGKETCSARDQTVSSARPHSTTSAVWCCFKRSF